MNTLKLMAAAAIMGLSKRQMAQRFDAIVAFAAIEGIIALCSKEAVETCFSEELVVLPSAVESVVSIAAVDRIAALVTLDRIVAGSGVDFGDIDQLGVGGVQGDSRNNMPPIVTPNTPIGTDSGPNRTSRREGRQ